MIEHPSAQAPAPGSGRLGEALVEGHRRLEGLCGGLGHLPAVGVDTDRWEAERRLVVLRRLRMYVMPREVAAVRVLSVVARRHLVEGHHWVRAYIEAKKQAEVSMVRMTWLDEKDPLHNDLAGLLCEQLGRCVVLESQLLAGVEGRLGPDEDARAARRFRRIVASRWTGTRPHPDLPAGSLVSLVLTPVVAVVDRARDLLDPAKVGT